ncbi:MAG: glucose 1-dehydrogenase [Firmicutes bacterium]|nr:glucose 1-dehydrogenase [Bacillota bacterium]
MHDLFSVKDKVVLITGSSRGLGAGFASGFAEHGAKVIVNGTNQEAVRQTVQAIKAKGGQVFGYAFDITDSRQVILKIAAIEEEVGPIDVLINNAGIHRRAPLEEMSEADWRQVIDLNLNAAFIASKYVAQGMIARRQGKIINITSLMAEGARSSTGNYAAAKGGLKMLTKAMATEWGKFNIQVNAIGPGYFKTELTQSLAADPQFDAWVKQRVPAERWGEPSDLLGAAIFLASKASDYINGQTIYVDGGWLAAL